jgi:hypothetical protein
MRKMLCMTLHSLNTGRLLRPLNRSRRKLIILLYARQLKSQPLPFLPPTSTAMEAAFRNFLTPTRHMEVTPTAHKNHSCSSHNPQQKSPNLSSCIYIVIIMYSDDQQSPFDVALSRPFLDEPTRKKWCVSKPSSWFSGSNNNSGTMSDYQDSDVESVSFGSEADHDYESHPLIPGASRARTGLRNPFDPIDDEIIMANGGASGPTSMRSKTVIHHPLTITDDDLEQARMSVTRNQEEVSVIKAIQQETLDIDLAIMMERQAELGEIAGSMRHLRDIQQGESCQAQLLSFVSLLFIEFVSNLSRCSSTMITLIHQTSHWLSTLKAMTSSA